MSGSGISWAICKFAPRSRQIIMPAPHRSVFLQAGCPSCRPTNSVKALKAGSTEALHDTTSQRIEEMEFERYGRRTCSKLCASRPATTRRPPQVWSASSTASFVIDPYFGRYLNFFTCRWLGNRVVSVLDSGAKGPGFTSQSRRCRVTVLGKLFTPIVPLFTKQQNW